jgi:cell division protein FtsA
MNMFNDSNIIAGLEIGTSKICAVVGKLGASGTLDILGLGQSCSRGVRDGEVVNPELVAEDLHAAVVEAGQMADVKIRSVYLGATGDHICGFYNRGVHPVVSADRKISPDDVADAIKNAIRLVRAMPLEVDGIVFNGLASAMALLTHEQKELGALVIDIGAGTTEYAVYADDVLRHSGVLMNGGNHISNDLAYGLKIPLSRAEKLKLEQGSALVTDAKGETSDIQIKQMQRIMSARLAGIFWVIAQELELSGLADCLRAGVFLCGGTARTPGIVALAEKTLQIKVALGRASDIGGLMAANQPEFATAIGLAKYGALRQRNGLAT